jgi:cytoplasmic polyadenylation element-binding protein
VKLLLQNCTQDFNKAGKWYYKISTNKIRGKDVEVIPWAISESNYVKCHSTKITGPQTIFVGALHGMLNAESLVTIMDDLFGGVAYAGKTKK